MMKTLKLLHGERISSANTHENLSPLAPVFPVQMPGAPFLARKFSAANPKPVSLPSPSRGFQQIDSSASPPSIDEAAFIYVVDDMQNLTDLYTLFLRETGYIARAFNHRAEALEALMADGQKPDLVITDYFGDPMPAERFMQRCLVVHPSIRILVATGLDQSDVRFSRVRPHGFIQKPFTPPEFLQEVRAALTAQRLDESSC
jgi:CheY-like chemotaxis protein